MFTQPLRHFLRTTESALANEGRRQDGLELAGAEERVRGEEKAADAADGIEELRGGVEGVTAIDSLTPLPSLPSPDFPSKGKERIQVYG